MLKKISVLKAKRFGVYSCHESSTLKEVATLLDERNISSLVVVGDTGQLRGIITRSDLVRACHGDDGWPRRAVTEFMNADVVTIGLDGTLYDVMELLIGCHIHRVVVVREEEGKTTPVGILSDADLVYHMARGSEEEPS